VLLVASEAVPLVKTGGLADVVAAMAEALHREQVDVTVLLPGYPAALEGIENPLEVACFEDLPCGPARLVRGRIPGSGLSVLLLDTAGFRARGENPYVDADGREYADSPVQFASLAHAAVRICAGATPLPVPHVVHANDWHAALIPALLRAGGIRDVGSVLTVHNLAFQGNYPIELAPQLGIPAGMTGPSGMEFWGRLSFMKAGIRYADRISIVSRSYAREVLTAQFGCGMEGVLNERREALVPIPNGVDVARWNPAQDALIDCNFSATDLHNKAICKRALLHMFKLPASPDAPLLALGSRITHQKMADVALAALPEILERQPDLRVVILGRGEQVYEPGFVSLAERYPQRVGVKIGYDERRAHVMHAGADMLLHGTRFEPFGLTPIYAMRYGTIPIASRVGGINDTIVDFESNGAAGQFQTGVLFKGERVQDMVAAVERALALYARPEVWGNMQRNAMAGDFSWDLPVRKYIALYRKVAVKAAQHLFVPGLAVRKAHSPLTAVTPV
jgi:starch synthase